MNRYPSSLAACSLSLLAMLTVSGLRAETGLTVADGSELIVNSTLTVNGKDIVVDGGGIMRVNSGSTTNADTLEIQVAGQLIGCGTINAVLVNHGIVQVDCGSSPGLVLTQVTYNHGDMILTNGSRLTATDAQFINYGTLDLSAGQIVYPSLLTNFGTVIPDNGGGTYTAMYIVSYTVGVTDVTVSALTTANLDYHLEYSDDLSTWLDASLVQPGGGVLDFVHVGGVGPAKRFYRVVEEAP